MMDTRSEQGIAVILALMAMLLLSAIGVALILATSSETIIAANFRDGQEGLYAADAAVERALSDFSTIPDWNVLLDGSTRSAFTDGPPTGMRTLADGSPLDLDQAMNTANCQQVTACSASDLTANTPLRPWGPNNPVWRLYAYGPVSSLLPTSRINSSYYVIVMVADDQSENDNDPLHDGNAGAGAGVLALRGEAFGPRAAHKVIELTVARGVQQPGVRILSWREMR